MRSFGEGPRFRGPSAITAKARTAAHLAPLPLLLFSMLVTCSPDRPASEPADAGVAISSTSGSPLSGCTSDGASAGRGAYNPGSEVEPTLAVDPGDPARIAVAWQQDRWFDGASRGIAVAFTSDGGTTWESTTNTRLSLCTGGTAATRTGFARVTDPWLSFGPGGELYLIGLSVELDPAASVGANPEAIVTTSSTDGGATWSEPITLVRDGDPRIYNDKPSVTADPNEAGSAYAVWHRLSDAPGGSVNGDTLFARSADGGETWERSRRIHGPIRDGQSFGNEIVVLPDNERFDGELLNVFSLISYGRTRAADEVELAAMSSDDGGRTWSQPAPIADHGAVPVRLPGTGQELKTGRLLPRVAVDPETGMVFVAWSDNRFERGRFNDVALSMSLDGGRSWSDPVKVNRTLAVAGFAARQTFIPEIAVTSEGEVAVSYFDFRNSDARTEGAQTDLFAVRCAAPSADEEDGCAGDWIETPLTQQSFDLTRAPNSGGPFLGDYVGLAGAGADVVTAFPQARDRADPSSIFFRRLEPTK